MRLFKKKIIGDNTSQRKLVVMQTNLLENISDLSPILWKLLTTEPFQNFNLLDISKKKIQCIRYSKLI